MAGQTCCMSVPGSNIRILRRQLGLSLRSLATATEIDPGNLSRLEQGQSGYSKEAIEKIAKVLHVSVGVLFAEPGMVQAAALRMREVPLLPPELLSSWRGHGSVTREEDDANLHTSLTRVSLHSFALRVTDAANLPVLGPGDELIFDPSRQPVFGSVVAAQDEPGKLYIGRLRWSASSTEDFEVVPYDLFFPVADSRVLQKLIIRGTLVESRRYH